MYVRLRVLLVEDNPGDADLVQDYLSQASQAEFHVECVPRLTSAISILEREQVDAILLDLGLPDSSGLETLADVLKAAPREPIIVLTGQDDEDLGLASLKMGAQDYLPKGRLSPDLLIRTVLYSIERKGLQDKLRKNEARLRLAQVAAKAGTWEWDLQTNENYWSDELWHLVGLEPHSCEPSYQSWLATIHPEDRGAAEQAVQEASARGMELRAEWRVIDKEGGVRWLMSRGRPIRDINGKPVRYLGIVMDITERKKSEEALRVTTRNLTEAQRVARIGSWTLDCKTENVTWSDELYRIFEIEKHDFRNTYDSFLNCVHPDDRQLVMETNARARSKGTAFDFEYRIILPSGKVRTINEIGYAERDNSGDVTGLFGTAQDITDRKEAERALREYEERLELALRGADLGTWDWKVQTGEQVFNDRWAEMLGYLPEEIGQNIPSFEQLVHPDDLDIAWKKMRMHLAGDAPAYEMELRLRAKTGEWRWILSRARITERDENGRPSRVTGTHLDITERKKAEEQAYKWSHVIENAQWGVVYSSSDLKSLDTMNPAFARMHGYAAEELRGMPIANVFAPEERASLPDLIALAHERGHHVWESKHIRKDGTIFPVLVNATAVRNEKGEVLYRAVNVQDITEQKLAEEKVRESERRYRDLWEKAPVMMISLDSQARINFASDRICEDLGYDRDELLGNTPFVFQTEESAHYAESVVFPQFLRTGLVKDAPLQLVRKNGEVIDVLLSVTAERDAEGKVVRSRSVFVDVTEQKRAESALRESERRYRTLFESATDSICILKAEGPDEGKIAAANKAAADMHGYTLDEILSLNIKDLNTPESAKVVPSRMERLLSGEVLREETFHRKKDGTVFPIEINARSMEIEGQHYILTIDRDISERKVQEAELRKRDSQQEALLNNIPDLAWLKDGDSRFIAVNESFARACGLKAEEVAGKTDLDIWPYELGESYRADDKEVMNSGTAKTVLEPLADHEGRVRWIETIKTPIRDHTGRIIGTSGIARDITDRRRDEEDLRQKTRDLRERYKELSCLYKVSQLVGTPWSSPRELLTSVLTCLPEAWQYPEITCARIRFDDLELLTDNFKECEWMLSSGIVVSGVVKGLLEMGYLEKMPQAEEGPFLKEERNLLNAVAAHLGRAIEREATDSALRESEQRFRAIFDNQHAVMLVIDPETGRIEDCSSGACFFYGCDMDTLTKKNISEITLLSAQEVAEKLRLAKVSHTQYFDFRHRLCNGEIRDVEVCSGPIVAGGKPLLFSVVNDVTDRKRAEEAKLKAQEWLELAVRGADIGLWDWRIDTGEMAMDKRSLGLLGYSPGDVEQTFDSWQSRIHPDDEARVMATVEQHLEGLTPVYSVEHRLRAKTGEWKWILSRGRVFERDENGRPLRMSGTVLDIDDRKKAEEALRQSEERYRTVADFTYDWEYWIDEHATLLYTSPSCERITGYAADEFMKDPTLLERMVHPDDAKVVTTHIHDEARTSRDTTYSLDFRIIDRDGQTKWLNHVCIPVTDADGKSLGRRASNRDITNRRLAEDALRESEERFRQVAEVAEEWIWEVDENGLYRYCSSSVERILGYNPEELVGRKYFWEVFSAEERDQRKMEALELFADMKPLRNFVNRCIRKDGGLAVLETSGAPVFDGLGNLTGYRGVDMDITERIRSAESQALLAAVVEHASEAIVVTDRNGIIKYVNPAFEKSSGYEKDEALGNNPRILKSGKHDPDFYRDLWNTIVRGDVWKGTLINKRKDGTFFEEEATISPITGPEGKNVNYVAVKRDVTQEAQLQRQLVQSQKMEAMGTLAGGIAHDFNNMLFAMTGYTELAMDSLPAGSEVYSDLKRVLDAGKRAGEMVKQILTFSRQADPQKKPLDLVPILKEGLKFLRASIPTTIEIRQDIQSDLGKVNGDPTQIHQVLMNFCTNAAYAMQGTKGVLSVELAGVQFDREHGFIPPGLTPGKYLRMTVSDTGHGIPKELLDRIFEPYFTTKSVGEGTGLGLSVVHGIVKSHGGAIEVESEIDKGTTFRVYLPIIEEDTKEEGETSLAKTPTGNERILLVDDEQILLEMGQSILGRLGYRVETKTNPLEALELFRSDPHHFDLVITDLTMPKMTGDDLAQEVKRIRPEIPVVLCTGFSEWLTHERLQESGIDALMKKPFLKNDIATIVRKLLDQTDRKGYG